MSRPSRPVLRLGTVVAVVLGALALAPSSFTHAGHAHVAAPSGAPLAAPWGSPFLLGLAGSGGGPAAFEGRYVLGHGDDFGRGRSTTEPPGLELKDGTLLHLDFPGGRAPTVAPGTRIRLSGVRSGNRVAVAAGST
ncbi:MAG: hypothetical protein ACRC50_11625, partial [Gaiella sp.]